LVARRREDLVGVRQVERRGRLVAPDAELIGQARRDRRGVAVRAPVRLDALAEDVVELEELDDAIPAVAEQLVEAAGVNVHRVAGRGEAGEQRFQRQLDEDDRRRLERLQEPRRQPDRDAVADPEALAVARAEGQATRRECVEVGAGGRAREIGGERRPRLVVGHVGGGVDAADAAAGRQADVPDPAGGVRGGGSLRRDRAAGRGGHLHRERAVVEQLAGAIDERHAEGAADQQRGMAGAVDEQVAGDRAVVARLDRHDVAVLGLRHPDDVVADVPDAELRDAVAGEQRRELAGVEVVGVVQRAGIVGHRTLARREIGVAGGALRTDRGGEGASSVPRRDEIARLGGEGRDERVVVTILAGPPAVEARTLLERRVAGEEEVRLRQPDRGERAAHRRPRALADADRRHVGRFDQSHLDR